MTLPKIITVPTIGDRQVICIPIHPDESHIPDSLINLPLPSGKVVTISGPIGPKTMGMLHDTLMICKPALVRTNKDEDFQI